MRDNIFLVSVSFVILNSFIFCIFEQGYEHPASAFIMRKFDVFDYLYSIIFVSVQGRVKVGIKLWLVG